MTNANAPVVTLEHAKKAFGANEVLKDISLTVNRGDVLAIIGPSGGGKSTLLRCLTLLETLDAGDLSYGDLAVTRTNDAGRAVYGGKDVLAQAKTSLGLVFQTFNLFTHYLDVQVFVVTLSCLYHYLIVEVLQVIRDLAAERMTMVIVTHEMSFARDVADHLIFMDDGRVVEAGRAADVINNPAHERTRAFLSRYEQG